VASGATPSSASSAGAVTPSPSPTGPVVGGWYAGASGPGVADGAFQKWLGQPVTIAGTRADQDARAQERPTPLGDEYGSWKGALDVAVAGTVLGSTENYAAAARGAYDARTPAARSWPTKASRAATSRTSWPAPTWT
jgi:hypothetical protein